MSIGRGGGDSRKKGKVPHMGKRDSTVLPLKGSQQKKGERFPLKERNSSESSKPVEKKGAPWEAEIEALPWGRRRSQGGGERPRSAASSRSFKDQPREEKGVPSRGKGTSEKKKSLSSSTRRSWVLPITREGSTREGNREIDHTVF